MNIESLYHKQYNENHGQESQKTFYMYRNLEKSYHIDYIFASNNLVKNGYQLTFEDPKQWIDKSDHIPIILDNIKINSQLNFQDTYISFVKRHLQTINTDTISRYQNEVNLIEMTAEKMDLNPAKNESVLELIRKIEILKKIDKLSQKLQ